MRIAYVIAQTLLGRSNGVVSQALSWKSGLTEKGLEVVLINSWETYDWSSFDVIHIFGMGPILDIVPGLRNSGAQRIVVSPIYDSNRPTFLMNALSRIDFPSLRTRSHWSALRSTLDHIDTVLVRSKFEADRVKRAFGIPREKIALVPLSVRFKRGDVSNLTRDDFCLHVSLLSAETKNVRRLVEAAVLFNFDLVLCGGMRTGEFKNWLQNIIRKHQNVKYLGHVNDVQLKDLYSKARVFALPSTMEGVGLVGLEAAIHGADIVVTNIGAPHEYYDGLAHTVDPYSIRDIGSSILAFLNGATFQPMLVNHIEKNYSPSAVAQRLIDVYNRKPIMKAKDQQLN